MSRLSIYATVLEEKYGLKPAEAEEFVANMFSVIREKLEEEKLVKVKGLGTFKLAEMNARESVNVNTGERITIEGRNKISFTPENAVRDRINAPFSQFESIDIDTDVDFSAIDKKYESEPEAPVDEPTAVAEEEKAEVAEDIEEPAVPADEPVEEPVAPAEEAVVESIAAEKPAEEPAVELEAPVIPVEEPVAPVVPDTPLEEPAEQTINLGEQVVLYERTEAEEAEEKEEPVVRSPYCENLIREELEHSHRIIRLLKTIIALIAVLFVVACAYFGYHFWQTQQPKAAKPQSQVEQIEPKPVEEAVDSAAVDSATNVVDTVPEAEPVAQPAEPAVDANQEIYNKDARVRTGAYRIVGIDTTVTVRKGQTFKGITKAYLGEGMECYIEAVNDWKTSVEPGDKLNIPKLELKKRKKK